MAHNISVLRILAVRHASHAELRSINIIVTRLYKELVVKPGLRQIHTNDARREMRTRW